jgi:signal recognition particle receptor subunit beta
MRGRDRAAPPLPEIDGKIVFAGPPGSGKTELLRAIHARLDPATRGALLTPAEDDGSTVFFDLTTLELGTVDGRPLRVQLLTAPGEPERPLLRRTVLRGADAVVFVADSDTDRRAATRAALDALERDLAALAGDGGPTPPVILLYNKRDLPSAASREELDRSLNAGNRPAFEASATRGEGLIEPLVAAAERLVRTPAQGAR